MGTGLIVAFVVAVWAAYFVPLALRRYDEASKNESVESSGVLSRVIPRRSETAEAEVAPERSSKPAPAAKVTPKPAVTAAVAPTRTAGRAPADRPAARLAARRRRRTLLTLLAATAIVGGLVGFAVIPMPWIAAPLVLVVAWLVACRIQVRGERGMGRSRTGAVAKAAQGAAVGAAHGAATGATSSVQSFRASRARRSAERKAAKNAAEKERAAARPADPVPSDEEETIVISGQFEDINPGRKNLMEDVPLEDDALDDKIVIAVPSVSTTGEALWDPLPVTLPTYVTKPRAGRTVRTIDFTAPGAWTSGHIEGEDIEMPRSQDDSGDERRAVGH